MHLRHILRPALVALTLTLAAPAHAADPVFPPASRVGLAVPAGFTPSARFLGFENQQASALIVINELPADAYADIEKGFSDDAALKSRGWTVQVREPWDVPGVGRIAIVNDNAGNTMGWMKPSE